MFPGIVASGGCGGTLPCSNPDYRETSFGLYKNTTLETFSCRYGCPNAKKKNAVHNLIHSLTGLHTKILALEHVSLCRNVFIR